MRCKLGRMASYVGLALALLGLCTYVARNPVRDLLGHTASAWLSRRLNGTLEIGALRGSLFSSLVLRDVVLRDRRGAEVARLDEVQLKYDLRALRPRRLVVQRVDIVRPQATLVQEPGGAWNIDRVLDPLLPARRSPAAARTTGGKLPVAIVVERIQIHAGQVAVQTPALPGVQSLAGLQAHLQGEVDTHGFRFQVHSLTVRATPAEVVLHTVQGTIQGDTNAIRIEAFRLQTTQTLVTADGILPGSRQPASLTLHMQPFDMAELGRLLQRQDLYGLLSLSLTAQGPPDALSVRGQLSTAGGQLDLHGQLNTVATPWRYSSSLALTHVNLATLLHQEPLQSDLNLHLHLEGAGLAPEALRGEVYLDVQPSAVGSVTLHPSGLHIAVQYGRVQVQYCDLHTSVARLTATGLLDLAGSSALQYDLTADLAGLRSLLRTETLDGTLHLWGQASGALTAISVQGTLEGQRLRYAAYRLETLQLLYAGAQLGAQPHVTAHLGIRRAHVGSVPVERLNVDATYDWSVSQLQVVTEVVQSSVYSGKARGTLTWAETGQQIVVDELLIRLADHPWRTVAPIEVSRAAQGLRLMQFHMAHADEALELSGAFDGQHFQDVHMRVAQLDLTFAQRLMPLPELVQGRATLHAHLTGTVAAPLLDMALTLRPEPRQHMPLDQIEATLAYAQQQLQSAVRVRQANREVLTVAARLPVDLALTALLPEQRLLAAPVALHVRLQQPDLAAVSRWQPTLPRLTGTLQGDLHVQGTYTALELDADVRLQQWGLQGRVEQVSAPLRLQGTLALAPPGTDAAPTTSWRRLLPCIQKAVLRVPTLRGQLPGQGQPPRAFQVQDFVLQAAGQWSADGFDGALERLQTQVHVTGWPRAEVFVAGRLTPRRLDLTRLQVRLPQSEVRATGSLTLPQRHVQLRLDVPRLQLDEVGFSLPASLPPLLQGVIEVHGQALAPQVEARLQYAGGQLSATLAAQLQEPTPRYSATLHLDDLNMAHVLSGEQGTLRARLHVQGTGFVASQRRAEVELRLETSGLTLAPGLTARVQGSLTGNTVRLEEMQVRSAPGILVARGTISPTATTPAHTSLTYEVTLGDLTPLQRYLGVPLQAKGSLSGTVQGTWPALQVRHRLQLHDWEYGAWCGQRVQAELAVSHFPTAPQTTIKAQVIDIQGPALPRSSLTFTGTSTPSQGTVQVSVTAGPYYKTGLEGRFTWADEQRLTLSHLRLQHQELAWDNAGPITITRGPQGRLALQRLLLRSGRQEVSAQGILMPEGTFEADVQVQHLLILPHVHAVAPALDAVDGEVALHLSLRGTLTHPQGEGVLHVTSLRWQQHALGEVHSQLHADGTTLGVDLHWRDQKRELLHVYGDVALDMRQALALQLRATDVDLQVLTAFSSAVAQSAGTLSLDLRLAGTLQQPQAYGTLRLDNGALQLAATGVQYKALQVQIVCIGQRVELTQLHAESGDGSLDLTGWAESTRLTLQHLDLVLQMHEFTLMRTPDLEAVVSAALTLRGSLEEMVATGTVTVPRARAQLRGKLVGGPEAVQPWQLTVDGVYGSGLPKTAAREAVSAARQMTSGAFLRADVQLALPRNVWVRGHGTAIELSGALTVTKELGTPFVLRGTLETVRGFTSFYSGKFALERGRVTFTGSPEIDPTLDVTVTRAVAGYVVSVNVSGRAKSPQLRLSSTPDLPQADIVTLLVVGKTTDHLTASERSGLSGRAQQIVGNVAAGEMEQLLAKPLGLDTLDIQTGDKLGSGKVSVGRYITQDIFLSYERRRGEEGGNKVGIEYSINRHLKVKGSSSDTGDSAVDILWRIDY